MTTTTGRAQHTIRRVLDEKRHMPGVLLPILHAIQDTLGHVPAHAAADIAEALNLSRAEGVSAIVREALQQHRALVA